MKLLQKKPAMTALSHKLQTPQYYIAKFDEFELNRRCARMPNILDLDRVKKFQPLILTKVAFRAIRAKKFRKRTPPKVAILGRFKTP